MYRAELDGLRAIAVIPVVFFHAGLSLFSGGFIGVDVFFVISGYLITTILIEDLELKQLSIIDFYERRARRILPALIFVMLVCIPFACYYMIPSQMKDFSFSLIAVSLFGANIFFWDQTGYFFELASNHSPLLHTWSLAIEEQFYLFFPLFLLLIYPFGKQKVFWTMVIIAMLSFLLSEYGWRNHASANFYFLPTRAWELLFGSIAALIIHKHGVKKNNFLSIIGLIMIVFSIFYYDEKTPFPSVYTLVPVIGTFLLILFASKDTFVAKLLSKNIFVGIGLISYSAYLWHQPLFTFARLSSNEVRPDYVFIVLSFTSFLLAFITWSCIEKPFRNKNFLKQSTVLKISFFSILLMSFLGVLGYKTNGFESYISNYSDVAIFKSIKRSAEQNCTDSLSHCISKASSQNTKNVLLLGDSNAYHFSKALKEVADKFDYSYIQLTKGGCMPLSKIYLIGYNNFECIEFNKNIENELLKSKNNIDLIVVSAAWLLYFRGTRFFEELTKERSIPPISKIKISKNGFHEMPFEERSREFEIYFDNAFKVLYGAAKNVVVVGPMPPAVVNFGGKETYKNPKVIRSEDYLDQSSEFEHLLNKQTAKHSFQYINLRDKLCGPEYCNITNKGLFLYGDETHLSDYGQSHIFKPLFEQIFLKD